MIPKDIKQEFLTGPSKPRTRLVARCEEGVADPLFKTSESSSLAVAAQAPPFRGSLYGAEAKHTTAKCCAAK